MFALVANAAFLAVEVVGGFAFGSLSLLADAAHMATDVVVLGFAYAALRITQRPPTDRHTSTASAGRQPLSAVPRPRRVVL